MQLLTGSRLKGLEGQAVAREGTAFRHRNSANKIFRRSFEGGPARDMDFVRESFRTGAVKGSAERAARAAGAEREAVQGARGLAAKAGVVGAAGVAGGAALSHGGDKTASTLPVSTSMLEAVTGRNGAETMARVAKLSEPVLELTHRAAKSGLSTGSKVIGGAAAAGIASGAALAHHRHKEAARKLAFGAALMAGLKGIGQFAGTAAKGIQAAGKAGGLAAAGTAAKGFGQQGLRQAGSFIAKNPGAGAALVAAPAVAAGYAAGR